MDTYDSIASVAESGSLRRRVTAAAAQQNVPGNPEVWTYDNRFGYATAPGWGAAWESALAGSNPDPGADPAVITDAMILSQVQAMLGGAG